MLLVNLHSGAFVISCIFHAGYNNAVQATANGQSLESFGKDLKMILDTNLANENAATSVNQLSRICEQDIVLSEEDFLNSHHPTSHDKQSVMLIDQAVSEPNVVIRDGETPPLNLRESSFDAKFGSLDNHEKKQKSLWNYDSSGESLFRTINETESYLPVMKIGRDNVNLTNKIIINDIRPQLGSPNSASLPVNINLCNAWHLHDHTFQSLPETKAGRSHSFNNESNIGINNFERMKNVVGLAQNVLVNNFMPENDNMCHRTDIHSNSSTASSSPSSVEDDGQLEDLECSYINQQFHHSLGSHHNAPKAFDDHDSPAFSKSDNTSYNCFLLTSMQSNEMVSSTHANSLANQLFAIIEAESAYDL